MRRRPWAVRRRPPRCRYPEHGRSTPPTLVHVPRQAPAALVVLATVAMLVPAAGAAAPPELSEFPLAAGVSPFGIALGSATARCGSPSGPPTRSGGSSPTARSGRGSRSETGADPTAMATGRRRGGVVHRTGLEPHRSHRTRRRALGVPRADRQRGGRRHHGRARRRDVVHRAQRPPDRARRHRRHHHGVPAAVVGAGSARHHGRARRRAVVHRAARQPHRPHHDRAAIVTEWPLPVAAACPRASRRDPTERCGSRCARPTASVASRSPATITTYPVPTDASDPTAITAGWDGAMWFTGPDTDLIGRVALDGAITEFSLPKVGSSPFSIAAGPDDAVWFTEGNASAIGRLGAPADAGRCDPAHGPHRLAGRRRRSLDARLGARGRLHVHGRRRVRPRDLSRNGARRRGGRRHARGASVRGARGRRRGQHARRPRPAYMAFSTHRRLGRLGRRSARACGRRSSSDSGRGRRARRLALVAAGFPVSRQVDCAEQLDRRCGAASPADVRLVDPADLLGHALAHRAIMGRHLPRASRSGSWRPGGRAPTRRSWWRSAERTRSLRATRGRRRSRSVEQQLQLVAVEAAVVPGVHTANRQLDAGGRARLPPPRGRRSSSRAST